MCVYCSDYSLQQRCVKTTTVKGQTIPEGMCIMAPTIVLHKDPRYWVDPEQFNPERYIIIVQCSIHHCV